MQNFTKVVFRSAHGDRVLSFHDSDTILDVCRRHGIPTTQVSTYMESEGENIELFVRPYQTIADYAEGRTVYVVPNRNIDYLSLVGGQNIIRERPGASTWVKVPVDPRESGGITSITEYLRPDDAKAIVNSQIKDALEFVEIADQPLVIGVSGGGDSNALLSAIVHTEIISKENIIPVMMLGIPDWDKGHDRAKELCEDHGLVLRTVTSESTAQILGCTDSNIDWVTSFERLFPGDDLEVLGVYAVRRVLEFEAKKHGAETIVIGSNLEDCLSDLLYYICAGQVPFPKPFGKMGDVNIFYPLWLTPKAVIDGCYPKYSFQNYADRFPSGMFGRAYYYYLAQMIVDAYPGAGQNMLKGANAISATHPPVMHFDKEFDTPTLEPIPLDIRCKLRELFS